MEKQYRDAFSSPLHTAVITYTYDSMNRLVSENCGDSRISYKYDLSGNRISRDTDGRTENYLYNSRNQLTQLTGDDKNISYTYDPAGNLTEEHSTEHKKIYFYDTYNRNTEITGNDFTQKNHYDAEGYRYSIEENDKVTNFVYRCGIMLAELDEAGNQAKTYTLGNEYAGHVSELNNSLTSENKAASYYITDEQGSIRYMLDQSGEVQNYYQYSAFGETIISEETTPNRLRYNAQTEDELTGLYYLRARYYAPDIGRFTQEDVIYNDGLNLYAYCNSNPVMYSDPSGFAKQCDPKVGGEKDSNTGKNSVYIPKDADGNPIPLNKQRINGQDIPLPDPAAQGRPHTVLGGKISSETGEVYRQSATFNGGSWPTANGYEVPLSEVHWTNHGRADAHTNPHQHVFNYDFDNRYWYRSDPEVF